MAIPGPGGLFGVTGPSTIAEDAIAATIIVGNSAQGDIVNITCHVVDDIAAGEALLPATGGILHIKRGTYNPAAAIILNVDNTIVQGEQGVIINKPVGLNLFEVRANYVIIRNLQDLNGGGDLTGGHLVDILNVDHVYVMDCNFFNNPGTTPGSPADGVHVESSVAGGGTNFVTVLRCRFDTVNRGVYAESQDAAAISNDNMAIKDCYFTATLREAIDLLFTQRSVLVNIHIEVAGTDGNFDGIHLRGRDAVNDSQALSMNEIYIEGATDDGVEVEFVDDSSFVKVLAINNNRDGINFNDVDRSIVSSSVCRLNGDDGIDINAASDRNIVIGCQFTGNAGTPIVDNGTNNQIIHNVIV
jgi:hypothetical protein